MSFLLRDANELTHAGSWVIGVIRISNSELFLVLFATTGFTFYGVCVSNANMYPISENGSLTVSRYMRPYWVFRLEILGVDTLPAPQIPDDKCVN